MSNKTEITFADVRHLFSLNDEFRWTWLRRWLWEQLFRPLLLGAVIVGLVFSIGFAFGKGLSAGLNLQPPTINLRVVPGNDTAARYHNENSNAVSARHVDQQFACRLLAELVGCRRAVRIAAAPRSSGPALAARTRGQTTTHAALVAAPAQA